MTEKGFTMWLRVGTMYILWFVSTALFLSFFFFWAKTVYKGLETPLGMKPSAGESRSNTWSSPLASYSRKPLCCVGAQSSQGYPFSEFFVGLPEDPFRLTWSWTSSFMQSCPYTLPSFVQVVILRLLVNALHAHLCLWILLMKSSL